MVCIAMASVAGAPGVTTTCLGLAAYWPGPRPIVVEADPCGGDIAVRFRIGISPGLVDLAAGHTRAGGIEAFTQNLPIGELGVDVVAAPCGGRQVAAALPELMATNALTTTDRPVIVDCGRLHDGSPAWEMARRCEVLVVVVAGVLDQIAHLRAHARTLHEAKPGGWLVAAAGGRFGSREITRALHRPHSPVGMAGDIPFSSDIPALMYGGYLPRRRRAVAVAAWRQMAACVHAAENAPKALVRG